MPFRCLKSLKDSGFPAGWRPSSSALSSLFLFIFPTSFTRLSALHSSLHPSWIMCSSWLHPTFLLTAHTPFSSPSYLHMTFKVSFWPHLIHKLFTQKPSLPLRWRGAFHVLLSHPLPTSNLTCWSWYGHLVEHLIMLQTLCYVFSLIVFVIITTTGCKHNEEISS